MSNACVIVIPPASGLAAERQQPQYFFEQSTVQDFAGTPIVSDMPRERVPTGESLVVLTRDKALVETLSVLGGEHRVLTVEAESDLAGELLARQIGVAII